MSRRLLGGIRSAIISGDYDLTRHAIDEMAEDGLGIFDVECAILDGELPTQPLLPDRQIRQPGGSKTVAIDGEAPKIRVLRRPWPGSPDPGRAG